MRHVALIDIGSNTIRLVTYDIEGDRAARLFSKKRMAGLADYVDAQGRLSAEGVDEACEAIGYLQKLCAKLGADEVHPFATASLRNVVNGAEAVAAIEARTGLSIDLVSEEDEALLGYAAFRHDAPFDDGALADIGGGSTEIVTFTHGQAGLALSVPIGSLKLFKRHVAGILPDAGEVDVLRQRIGEELAAVLPAGLAPREHICGIGGTARAGRKLVNRMLERPEHEQEITAVELDGLLNILCGDFPKARKLVLRTCPDRIHTIVPGLLVLQAVVAIFGARRVYVSDYGVREGYLHERVL